MLFGLHCTQSEQIRNQSDTDANRDSDNSSKHVFDSCYFVNIYTQKEECRSYYGSWTEDDIEEDCGDLFSGIKGELKPEACDEERTNGYCLYEYPDERQWANWYYELDSSALQLAESMCEGHFKGKWYEPGEQPDDAIADLLPGAHEAMLSNDDVSVHPECKDTACIDALSNSRSGIYFTPRHLTPKSGLIIVPGGSVDPRAYAVAAQMLAQQGLLVVILPYPGNYEHAVDIINGSNKVENWFIGGHSLGGTMAGQFILDHPNLVRGLFIWASTVDEDGNLADQDIPAISIYGTRDGRLSPDDFEASKALLPEQTIMVAIAGANHSQFGYYPLRSTDMEPWITIEHQHELFVGATLHFVNSVLQDVHLPPHPAFRTASVEEENFCTIGQTIIANNGEKIPHSTIVQGTHANTSDLGGAKPSIESGDLLNTIYVHGYTHLTSNPDFLAGPPIHGGELLCKMKNQDALIDMIDLATAGPEGTCALINEAILEWAVQNITDEEEERFLFEGPLITFAEDMVFETGAEWIMSEVTLSEINSGQFRLTSTRLRTDDTFSEEQLHNNFYCKLWSLSRALRFVLDFKN